jgi:MSHA biogenesis protein MshN
MSLINQMLQDLENRQAKKAADKREDFADGLSSVADYGPHKGLLRGFLSKKILIYFAIFAVIIVALMFMRKGKKPAPAPQVQAAAQQLAPQAADAGTSTKATIAQDAATVAQDASKVEEVASKVQEVTQSNGSADNPFLALSQKKDQGTASAPAKTTTQARKSTDTALAGSAPGESPMQQMAEVQASGASDVTLAQEIIETESPAFAPQTELSKVTPSPVIKQGQQLTFYFQSDFKYEYFTKDGGKQINIVIENVTVSSNILPVLEANSYIKAMHMEQEEGKVTFVIDLLDKVSVMGLETERASTPQKLILRLSGPQVAQQAAAAAGQATDDESERKSGTMSRVVKPLTAEEQLQVDYETALNELKQNKVQAAIDRLHVILEKNPDFLLARSDLMTIYLERREYQNVQILLNTGLRINPYYPPFVMMQARLFMLEGDNEQALLIIKSVRPDLVEYPDFYATMATLEQQLGNYQVAAQIYLELVRIEPQQGRWWLGYGLALEALGKRNVALQAYEKAVSTNSLPIDLEAYVKGRIDALGG